MRKEFASKAKFNRYKKHALAALSDRSCRPVRHTNQLPVFPPNTLQPRFWRPYPTAVEPTSWFPA
jgi:hypothetical protein